MCAKIENIVTEKISACISHPMLLISCRLWVVFSSCCGWGFIADVSVWQGWTFWSAEPCQSAGMLCCGTVRSDAGEVMSSAERIQAFSRWQDYDDQFNCHRPGPATALVRPATLSLPYLCLSAMPSLTHPPSLDSLSLSLTFFTCQTHHSVFSSSFFSTLLCLQKYCGSTTLQWW